MATNSRSYEFNVDRATAALEAGFATKAAQKDALADVATAYFRVREIASEAALAAKDDATYWGLPFDIHQVREAKHAAFFGEEWSRVAFLVDLRNAIKSSEIVRVESPNKAETELRARVERTISEEMARIGKQYADAIDLGRILKGLPVSANSHYVTNEFGTTFIRTFWYLNGELTRFNVIAAAYEALVHEGTIVENAE
jgi:hypothetical protein